MRPGSSASLVWVVWAPNAPWIGGTSIARPASVANTAALRRAAERIFATALLGSVSKTSVISVSPSSLGSPATTAEVESETEDPMFLRDVAQGEEGFQLFPALLDPAETIETNGAAPRHRTETSALYKRPVVEQRGEGCLLLRWPEGGSRRGWHSNKRRRHHGALARHAGVTWRFRPKF